MLQDSRSQRFVTDFVGQWLEIRKTLAMKPDDAYPEYDTELALSLAPETELYFAEMLAQDRSVTEFVRSDWTFLNARLAKHYGVAGVDGYELHKVVLQPEHHRGGVFARLFIDGSPDEVAREVRRLGNGRSILDSVRDQLRSLGQDVGVADRRRLDLLATSIREAEQSLAQDEAWAARPKPKVEAPEPDANEWVGQTRQWYDLIHLACQTDSTRVIVHRVPEQLPAPTIPGAVLGEHDASHHGKDPAKIEQVALFEDAHARLLDHLLTKLSDTVEGNRTLLDHTQVLAISNLGDGSAHASNNLPVLLAGGGFKHQGHIAFDRAKNSPLSNLYVRMLLQMGIPTESFGCSTGVLSELA